MFYRHRRKNAQGQQESVDEPASSTCADNTPSSSAGQRSSAHVPREPSPALDEAESSTCADDTPCSSTSQCSSDDVAREPSPTLEEAQFSDEAEDPESTASDDGKSPPHYSEDKILATAFGKLSSEKQPNLGARVGLLCVPAVVGSLLGAVSSTCRAAVEVLGSTLLSLGTEFCGKDSPIGSKCLWLPRRQRPSCVITWYDLGYVDGFRTRALVAHELLWTRKTSPSWRGASGCVDGRD
ncbi:hypothetical protein MRX96_043893 [Rhipicephalus microplus]